MEIKHPFSSELLKSRSEEAKMNSRRFRFKKLLVQMIKYSLIRLCPTFGYEQSETC